MNALKENNLGGNTGAFASALTQLMENKDGISPLGRKVQQKELAEALACKRQVIGCYMNGKYLPDLERFKKIADFFECSYDFLLGKSNSADRKNYRISLDTGLSDLAIASLIATKKIAEEELDETDQYYKIKLDVKKDSQKYISLLNGFLSDDYFIKYAKAVFDYIYETERWKKISEEIIKVELKTGRKARTGDVDLNMFNTVTNTDVDFNNDIVTKDDFVDELMLKIQCEDLQNKIKYQEWLMIEKLKEFSLLLINKLMEK